MNSFLYSLKTDAWTGGTQLTCVVAALVGDKRGQTKKTCPNRPLWRHAPLYMYGKKKKKNQWQNQDIHPSLAIYASFEVNKLVKLCFEISHRSHREFLTILKVVWGKVKTNYFPSIFSDTLGLLEMNYLPFLFLEKPGLFQYIMLLILEQIPGIFNFSFNLKFTLSYLPLKNNN